MLKAEASPGGPEEEVVRRRPYASSPSAPTVLEGGVSKHYPVHTSQNALQRVQIPKQLSSGTAAAASPSSFSPSADFFPDCGLAPWATRDFFPVLGSIGT